jgi:hypothetical protein
MFYYSRKHSDLSFYVGAHKALPRSQRRGAIIILGMLALSKRTIISEKVDTLLKIGLGPFGKVSARIHTSIPLRSSTHLKTGRPHSCTVHLPCLAAPERECEEGQRYEYIHISSTIFSCSH